MLTHLQAFAAARGDSSLSILSTGVTVIQWKVWMTFGISGSCMHDESFATSQTFLEKSELRIDVERRHLAWTEFEFISLRLSQAPTSLPTAASLPKHMGNNNDSCTEVFLFETEQTDIVYTLKSFTWRRGLQYSPAFFSTPDCIPAVLLLVPRHLRSTSPGPHLFCMIAKT